MMGRLLIRLKRMLDRIRTSVYWTTAAVILFISLAAVTWENIGGGVLIAFRSSHSVVLIDSRFGRMHIMRGRLLSENKTISSVRMEGFTPHIAVGDKFQASVPFSRYAQTSVFSTNAGFYHEATPVFDLWFDYVQIPYWVMIVVALVLPVRGARHILKDRNQLKRGVCFNCGYDLRASSQRCPECGTPIKTTTTQPNKLTNFTTPII
jgi:zinc-ribbon domain